MPILHPKALRDHAQLYKAQPFVQMSCVQVGCDYGVKLQDLKSVSSALLHAVLYQLLADM